MSRAADSWAFCAALAAANLDRDWWVSKVVPGLRQRWATVDAGRATRCRAIRAPARLPRPDSAAGRYLGAAPAG
jgi:hypothetical protein